MSPPRLAIDNLSVRIGDTDAVRDVSLSIAPGQIFGVAGESGSGKSMTALALMGLLPDGALRGGAARLDGEDLFALDEATMCGIRGRRIGMIFQEPMTALNPVRTIGAQVAETLVIHAGMSPSEARDIAAARSSRSISLNATRVPGTRLMSASTCPRVTFTSVSPMRAFSSPTRPCNSSAAPTARPSTPSPVSARSAGSTERSTDAPPLSPARSRWIPTVSTT
ncbi:MAG: ATP-binding cassette domain-containing protein, partial [Candidatus Puniceispirillaceae bacterium]